VGGRRRGIFRRLACSHDFGVLQPEEEALVAGGHQLQFALETAIEQGVDAFLRAYAPETRGA
jgi:hypothetical protein